MTGASGGLGREIAKALHERGASLLVSGRRAEALNLLADELDSRVETLPADLANPREVEGLVERAGSVDILVANAALPASGNLDSFSPEQLDRALNVNLRAPMVLARAIAPAMAERRGGHLIFVSSMSGKVSAAGSSVYSATKFGLRGFAFALHEELRDSGVGVTTVFPGFIRDAGMFAASGQRLPPGVATRTPRQVAQAVLDGIDGGRAEIDVAPLTMRVGGWLAGAAPGVVAAITRRHARPVADGLARAQRDMR